VEVLCKGITDLRSVVYRVLVLVVGRTARS
jgi:hypothetical protein